MLCHYLGGAAGGVQVCSPTCSSLASAESAAQSARGWEQGGARDKFERMCLFAHQATRTSCDMSALDLRVRGAGALYVRPRHVYKARAARRLHAQAGR